MELYEHLNPPPLVQQKKKYANFTIREIGGPAEIIIWRQQQEAKESIYKARLGERDRRTAAFQAEQGIELSRGTVGRKESWLERMEAAKKERQDLRTSQRQRFEEAKNMIAQTYIQETEPKKTIMERIKGFFMRIWIDANF